MTSFLPDPRANIPLPEDSSASPPWRLELEPDELHSRFAWARDRGHPGFVWPGVPPEAVRRGLYILEAVTRDVFGSAPGRLSPADPEEMRALGIAAFIAGMGPLVGHWISVGTVQADGLTAELFALHLAHGRARARRMGAVLEHACGTLTEAGIEPLVIKSGHTAWDYFPEPGTRPSADVDLIVSADAMPPAEEALSAAGFARTGSQRRPPKSDWLAPGSARLPRSLELFHQESQYALDLHASLERNFFGVRQISLTEVLEEMSRPAGGPSTGARVLRHPALLACQALHASEGITNLTLIRLIELVLIIRSDRGAEVLDWGELADLLEEIGGLGFVHPAFSLVEKLAPGTVHPQVLDRVARAAPPRLRRFVEVLNPAETAALADDLTWRERFLWCTTPSDHLRRLVHMLAPAPAGTPRELLRIYRERIHRLLRGRIELGER